MTVFKMLEDILEDVSTRYKTQSNGQDIPAEQVGKIRARLSTCLGCKYTEPVRDAWNNMEAEAIKNGTEIPKAQLPHCPKCGCSFFSKFLDPNPSCPENLWTV